MRVCRADLSYVKAPASPALAASACGRASRVLGRRRAAWTEPADISSSTAQSRRVDGVDHDPAAQAPQRRTLALAARERELEQRERVADEREASARERARQLRDLTASAQVAIERAQRHMETSTERLGRSEVLLRSCLERLRWISDELGWGADAGDTNQPARGRHR